MTNSNDYLRVSDACVELGGKSRVQVYEYLRRPEVETGIRRMRVGKTTFVHMPSLRAYEATVKPGRPRKGADEREESQHGNTDRVDGTRSGI